MGTSPTYGFRPMARTVIMLGAELIADEVTAVLELVKNAYDADADEVEVRISPTHDRIVIRDDGTGMSKKDIETKWLVPGTPSKAAVPGAGKPVTEKGRVTLGEKGIGRFAVHHLGRKLTMVSRKQGALTESVLKVDWDQYEDPAKFLDEVSNELKQKPPKAIIKKGTVLQITQLRSNWPQETVNRLGYVLALLTNAASTEEELFTVRLYYNGVEVDLPDLLGDALSSADHIIDGEISANGVFAGKVNGREVTRELFKSNSPEEITYQQLKKYPCGAFTIRMYVVNRSNRKSPLYRLLTKDPVPYQGFLLYRDEFRVLPYGTPGVDWLGLDNRRIKKLGINIGNSQILGFVNLTYDDNPLLRDKTNREGLIENAHYHTFRSLLLSVVNWAQAELKRDKKEPKTKPVIERIDDVLATAGMPAKAVEKLKGLRTAYERENTLRAERMKALTELAGVGLAAERLTHELGLLIRSIRTTLKQMERSEQSEFASQLGNYVTELERDLRYLQPLYRAGRRRKESVSIREVVEYAFQLFQYDFKSKGISAAITNDSTDVVLTGNRGGFLQVLVNLLDNAAYWVQKSPPGKRRIGVRISAYSRTVLVADSGPGVAADDRPMVFEPFFSGRGGRGLGLYIAKESLTEAGHDITISTDEDEAILNGAVFKLTLAKAED